MSTQPSCFGKRWDQTSVECKGGLDPLYSNPSNGTKLREKCSWFNSCGVQMQSNRTAPNVSPPLVPPSSLVRPSTIAPLIRQPPTPPSFVPPRTPMTQYTLPTSSPPAPPQLPYAAPPAQVQHYQAHAPQMMQQQVIPQNYAPPNVAQFGPAFVPMPYQNVGAQMPQYLTIPEPVTDDVHWIYRLGRELLRAIIKAFGHQLAAHVDSNPLQRHGR